MVPLPTFRQVIRTGTGSFTCELTDLTKNTKYYVKAYAKNSYGVAYGEEKSFTTDAFPTFQYGGHTYYVAPDPGNRMGWDVANSYCNSLTLEGLSGWKMPSQEELVQMYAERSSIGGFDVSYYNSDVAHNGSYWSTTFGGTGYHHAVFFYNGNVKNFKNYTSCRVRPIRKKN